MRGNVLAVPSEPTESNGTAAPPPRGPSVAPKAGRLRLSRRRLVASLASLPLFLATACQRLPNLAPPTPTPTGPRALRLAFPGGSITDDVTYLVNDAAQHIPPEANLRLEPVFVDVGAYDEGSLARYSQALKNLPAKDAPDLILGSTAHIAPLDKAGAIRDLRDTIRTEKWFTASDFYGNALVAGQLRGKQLAIPLDLSIEAVFYNQQAFAAAQVKAPQPGWTWDQFLAAAQTLTTNRSEDTSGRWGCQIVPFYPFYATMGWQRNAKVASDDGSSLDLTEPGTIEGMQFLADLILQQKVSPRLSPAVVADPTDSMALSMAIGDSTARVGTGQAAMVVNATSPFTFWWRPLNLGDVALAEMPMAGRKATTASPNLLLSVPTTPPDEKHSLNGLRSLVEAASKSLFLPARKAATDIGKLQLFLTEAEAAAVKSMLEGVRCVPASFSNNELSLVLLRDYFVPILSGQKSAAQAGKDAQPLVREALSKV